MTLYSVLVADCELQTVDCTGITEITISYSFLFACFQAVT
ncbi:hypothetical protein LSPH24S_06729 [Lysinibacillus sphaericus]